MNGDVAKRARQRAAEARERAREAGERAAELAAGERVDPDAALARAREALERAERRAIEGFRHAAEAERGAARAHEAIAAYIDQRAEQNPSDGDELHAEAVRHRRKAEEHRGHAAVDEAQMAELDRGSSLH